MIPVGMYGETLTSQLGDCCPPAWGPFRPSLRGAFGSAHPLKIDIGSLLRISLPVAFGHSHTLTFGDRFVVFRHRWVAKKEKNTLPYAIIENGLLHPNLEERKCSTHEINNEAAQRLFLNVCPGWDDGGSGHVTTIIGEGFLVRIFDWLKWWC